MEQNKRNLSLGAATLALMSVAAFAPGAAEAQNAGDAGQPVPTSGANPKAQIKSESATINLINALVEQGILTRAKADQLIAQADVEAQGARQARSAVEAAAQVSDGAVRVPYVPQVVRDQIRDEVRQDVMAQAKKENWAAPDALPEWTQRISLSGDFRLRHESRFFDADNNGLFYDFAKINKGSAYDLSIDNTIPAPILNSVEDRDYLRIRARLGLKAKVAGDLDVAVRLATGSDTSPVSTNQTLGGLDGKKDLWIDRAYAEYRPLDGLRLTGGRMANPFDQTELVWDDDVALDGVAASYKRDVRDGLNVHGTIGAFPLSYVGDSAPDASFGKFDSDDNRWLWAAEAGIDHDLSDRLSWGANIAYYSFDGVTAEMAQCFTTAVFCVNDHQRPAFMQRGNTLFAMRENIPASALDTSDKQYFGLASEFEILNLSAEAAFKVRDNLRVAGSVSFSKNLAFDEDEISKRATTSAAAGSVRQLYTNNWRCGTALDSLGRCPAGQDAFESGDSAWLAKLSLGAPEIKAFGDWGLSASYRYVEGDALLDGFVDSDFGLGGTNQEGYIVGGAFGLTTNTSIGARWLSANEIEGPPLAIDVLQLDLNVKF